MNLKRHKINIRIDFESVKSINNLIYYFHYIFLTDNNIYFEADLKFYLF